MIDFDMFKTLTATGETVFLKVKGSSMMPFLKSDKDSVAAKRIDGKLKKGDIVFYSRMDSVAVMHRIMKIENDKMWLCGDAQQTWEGPLNVNSAFAKVVSVIHNGKTYDENSFYFKFFSKIWINLTAIRPYILKLIK